ncbi:polyprenyl synthetase family protein [Alkalicaulis satelles]|uniref:Polyprenyl synthetase family protein n=1 Tax=Alkalicaulis satelles TaxID=2609175 RepID=A0A5M6ZP74_9PROT|nr:polyprenyl synthetase family protein [Alkalicaulis satelles]
MSEYSTALSEAADRITVALDALLPRADGPEKRLISAMRYAALGPGKRMRPFLLIECGRLVGADERALLRAACAVECVHAYSLVHDDLPSMDNDDLRRGRPTVHKAYDEATAILAGDALQTQAFAILADPETHPDAALRCELVSRLAQAAGARGMAGGQMIDMAIEAGEEREIGVITRCQRMKTGALIAFCAEAGAVLARADKETRTALEGFAHDLGLCYQIVDDLLDVEGDETLTGKRTRKDAGQGKATFVTILGVDGARDRARHLAAQAKEHLVNYGEDAKLLIQTVDYVLDRQS